MDCRISGLGCIVRKVKASMEERQSIVDILCILQVPEEAEDASSPAPVGAPVEASIPILAEPTEGTTNHCGLSPLSTALKDMHAALNNVQV